MDFREYLHTNHINYLIWRYLQERGYGKTAIQLQRDWQFTDPQSLPFAETIKQDTLVSVIQDGLRYDDLLEVLERKRSHRSQETGASESDSRPASGSSRKYSFIQNRKRQTSQNPEDIARKRQRLEQDGTPPSAIVGDELSRIQSNQSHVIDRRKSAPKDLSVDTGLEDDDAMDDDAEIDQDQDQDQAEEQSEPEPEVLYSPLRSTLELGQNSAMQSEPVIDRKLMRLLHQSLNPKADIVSCFWDPIKDNRFLATGGSIFKAFVCPSDVAEDGEPKAEEEDLLSRFNPDCTTFGTASAVSTTTPAMAHSFETSDGEDTQSKLLVTKKDEVEVSQEHDHAAFFLRFSPDGSRLLIGALEEKTTGICRIYDVRQRGDNNAYPLLCSVPIPDIPLDGVWLSATSFAICGASFLSIYDMALTQTEPTDEAVEQQEGWSVSMKRTTTSNQAWEQVAFDTITRRLACSATDTGYVGLLHVEDFTFQAKAAHDDQITGLQWQPISSTAAQQNTRDGTSNTDQERLLATSCVNGTIKIWNAQTALECLIVFNMGDWTPALALAFSPNANYLAVAGGSCVKVWEARPPLSRPDKEEEGLIGDDEKYLVGYWKDETAASDREGAFETPQTNGISRFVDSDDTDTGAEQIAETVPEASNPEASEAPKDQAEDTDMPDADSNTIAETTASTGEARHSDDGENGYSRHLPSEQSSFHTLAWKPDCTLLAYGQGEQLFLIDVGNRCNTPISKVVDVQEETVVEETKMDHDGTVAEPEAS